MFVRFGRLGVCGGSEVEEGCGWVFGGFGVCVELLALGF